MPGNKSIPDKMLQARLFSYSNTHRHYLGANYSQIPFNCPYHAHVVCWLLIFFAKQYINSITHFYSIMILGQELSKRRPNDSRYKPRRMPQLLSQFLWWTQRWHQKIFRKQIHCKPCRCGKIQFFGIVHHMFSRILNLGKNVMKYFLFSFSTR